MGIVIDKVALFSELNSIKSDINTKILGSVEDDAKKITDGLINSQSQHAEMFKVNVNMEKYVIQSVGEALLAITEYIELAANEFVKVDKAFAYSEVDS